MMHCSSCLILFDGHRCPICGSKNVDLPQPRDYCLLTKKDQMWAGMLEDVLEQNRIPFTTQSHRMAGLSLRCPVSEEVRFYVPYGWYEQALEIEKALFEADNLFADESWDE